MIQSRRPSAREFTDRDRESVATYFDKIPPQDLIAERSVLGSILLLNDSIDDVQPHLPSADRFYADAHRRMYLAIQSMLAGGGAVDVVTLAAELEKRGDLEQIGGPAYLLEVLATVPHSEHAEYYAKIVRDKWLQRWLIDTCSESLRDAFGSRDVAEVQASIESRIRDLGHETATDPVPFKDALDSWIESLSRPESRRVVETGFRDLDDLLNGGLRGGQLAILAARPRVGKSALAGNVSVNVAMSRKNALLFIFEQSQAELLERILAAHAKVDHGKIIKRELDQQEEFAFGESAGKLRDAGLYFDAVKRRNVADISAVCRRHKRKHGLDLVVIDYLQLVQPTDSSTNREQQVSGMSRDLKILAMELDVPILCLAQLNRQVEHREKQSPRLSDLRESGAIEQDADVVMFIDRPHLYDESAHPGDARLFVEKNRSGQPGKVDLIWRGNNLLFLPKAPAYSTPSSGDF